jgi:long-chain acyl-CoA synthetase
VHHFWNEYQLSAMRNEAHFADRVVRCFTPRVSSVYALFERSVAQHPDREAVVCGDVRLSYRSLAEQVDAAAHDLRNRGIHPGDRVALLISNRIEFIVAFLATQELAAVTVPISVREQASGIEFMLQQCEAALLLFDSALADRAPASTPGLSVEDWVSAWAAPKAAISHASDPGLTASHARPNPNEEDTAVILYTSGTTGRPKGAMLTHLNIVHSVMHYIECMHWNETSRSIMAVPASHVTGLIANVACAIGTGACTIIMPGFKAGDFLRLAANERLTHTILVPAMYNLCLLDPAFDMVDLSAWQVGGYGGAPMPMATIDALATRLPSLKLQNAYGATETTSPTTMMPPQFTRDHLDSIGVPLPCAELCIMDEAGCEVAPGVTGEIWIRGPMVVKGYWNNPEATAREFTAGFWHSGDLGSVDEQGFVRIFDRKKDMLNRGGFKIYSVEVENLLIGYPGVVEAAIVGKPCPVLGERVHAFVSGNISQLSEAALRAYCARHLADYKVPESIVLLEEPLPRNANGKLLKRELRERLQQSSS